MSLENFSLNIGAVVIGRNEGQRLIRCLQSLADINSIVYVDSGSTDGSVDSAKELGIEVVELDTTIPFTAARARNTGFNYLLQKYPDIKFIQFVDGDCEIAEGWIEISSQFFLENPDYAVVCGRRRERFPKTSIYNQLCDIEWNTSIGDTLACGGDALIRASAFRQINGYRDSMIAGEEPEMCYRLRSSGWKIYRLDAEMTKHDAEMTRISQWWKRSKRAGHAYAETLYIHHSDSEKFRQRELVSILLWSLAIPVFIIVSSITMSGYWVIFSAVYPLQILRLSLAYRDELSHKNAFLYACSNVLGKFAQLAGVISFVTKKIFRKDSVLIEYK
jgi:glycosyltransferase involved in cell wall biosynthesis